MNEQFAEWLSTQAMSDASRGSRLSNVRTVSRVYDDLDEAYEKDGLEGILGDLQYSTADQRKGVPNPSRIPINGDIYNGLATLRGAVTLYRRFKEEAGDHAGFVVEEQDEGPGQNFALEKDLQTALRAHITQLGPDLEIADGGSELTTASGRIDILATDQSGADVVIELKAVKAPLKTLAQIASYMGDRAAEGRDVRGIIVAPDFDAKLISAARVTPNISLVRYGFQFTFEPQD
ncbi:MAG: endonuclease NucS domain-containing protein [Parvularcula sp.]|jgi:hypothetical protein|nr:endonuclease NucS domain-containing protein [Parvularcula sp.]